MSAAPEKNRLDQRQMFRLCAWAEANYHAIADLTRPQIAERASAEVGFDVTASNVVAVAFAINKQLGGRKNPPVVRDSTKLLAATLVSLCERLGEPVPDELRTLSRR